MIARQSVWSDPKIQKLVEKFVPAADEVGRLQSGKDEDCLCFQKVAEQGHYAGRVSPSATRQGTYAMAPSGVFLASINSNDAAAMARMLEKALLKWSKLAPAERLLPEAAAARTATGTAGAHFRWEQKCPKDGLILCVHTRDLPRENAGATPIPEYWRHSWNQDYAWFTQAEARSFFAAPAAKGARHDVPRALIERIARCHLIDNVRGQTGAYSKESLEKAELKTEVTDISGEAVTLRIKGVVRIAMEGNWSVGGLREPKPSRQKRGYEAKLLGRAVFDLQSRRFSIFELLASGQRWGGTQYNGRGNDLEPAPMAVAFTRAGDTPAEQTAPALIWEYGWSTR